MMHFLGSLVAALLALTHATFAQHAFDAHTATILFGGDMMFDRSVRTTLEQYGGDHLFSCIDSTLRSADLVVANLEGPITLHDSQSVGSTVGAPDNFIFTFPPETAMLLIRHHISIVNLGNNHIMNLGTDGVRSTLAILDAAHVQHFGDPLSSGVAEKTINGISFTFINYNEFTPTSLSAGGGDASTTLEQIRTTREAGKIPIVYTHWGIEYATTSPSYVHTLAHEFVLAGAAIVIGSHPHVVEEKEIYQHVPIYYSLGNFIFDQYWNDSVDHGLMLSVVFDSRGAASIREIPIVLLQDRRTCPVQ